MFFKVAVVILVTAVANELPVDNITIYNTYTYLMFLSTVHHSIELFQLPTLMHNSLFINNMYVTLLSSKHVEDNSVTYVLLMNKEL